eukprot:g14566.t1
MEPAPSTAVAEAADIEQLDRVLHRLVVADDAKLSPVLDLLLPKLVLKLNGAAPGVRAKVIDVLSHISKRVRPNPSIVLPCAGLLAVCKDVPASSFAFNFSLSFLEMGVPRLAPAEQGKIALEIASGISRLAPYSPPSNILLNLLLVVVEHLPLRLHGEASASSSQDRSASAEAALAVTELAGNDAAVVSDWFLDVCLYPGVLMREGSRYDGLSPAGLARLTSKEKEWPTGLLTRRKLAVVRALKSDLFSPGAAVCPAVAAAGCSTHHEVLKASEDLLKSLSSSDRHGALQRDATVASSLLGLVLGGQGGKAVAAGSGTEVGGGGAGGAGGGALSSARSPASAALAVRALAWLEAECPEGTAARVPEAVRVSFLALFTADGSDAAAGGGERPPGAPHHDRANFARFRAAGARLAAFIAARCNAAMLPVVGPLLLQAVQRVLVKHSAPSTSAAAAAAVGGGTSGVSEAAPPPAGGGGATLLMQIQHAAMLEACYEAISSLATRRPELFAGDTSVPRLLFLELSAKEPSLRVKISAALGALKGAYRSAGAANLTSELWSLLWGAAASAEYRARLCAVEWACDLFDFSDVPARRLCVSLCDDKVTAVRSAASRGLHPPPPRTSSSIAGDATGGNGTAPAVAATAATAAADAAASRSSSWRHPRFEAFVLGALREETAASSSPARGGEPAPATLQELPPAALARALDFALECHRAHGGVDEDGRQQTAKGEREREGTEEAVAVFLSVVESTLESAPSAADGQHGHAQMVRLHRSAAVALQRLAAGDAGSGERGAPFLHDDDSGHQGTPSPDDAVARSAAPIAGVAASLASRGPWLQQWLGHEVSTEIREAFAETAGAAAEFMEPDSELVPLLRALGLKLKVKGGTYGEGGEDGRGITSVEAVFERLWAACALGETSDASRRTEAAAEALGRCCRGDGGSGDGEEDEKTSARVRKTLRVLFDMAKNQKQEELQFAVGAAVADLACSGPLRVPAGKLLENMRASALAARRGVEREKAEEEGAGGAVVDALDYVLYQVLYVLLEDNSPHVSGAAAVYLLAVVQRCRGHHVLDAYLPDVQAAFTRKLTVRSEFVQEVAGKGLALVYQAAGSESKQGLVDSLVDALSTGRRRAAASGATTGTAAGRVDVHGATHAGAALSEAGAGAYGEMCAVANDVGRPDLIYSFLSMASHHAAWTTRRGASFGLGAIMKQVSAEAFGGQLGKIVPRLYRYRFDPSSKTRAAMDQLWRAVVGGNGDGGDFSAREKEVIRSNLSAIVKELLRALGDRKWRDRQSACAGLSDVLRGRGWDEIGPHLEMLWTMADRGLDDIKESVAEAAVEYAKTVSNISVRLCDPYSFVPPAGGSGSGGNGDTTAAAAAAARSDAAGDGPDAVREEVGEARRSIGTMLQDFQAGEAEARARGEEGTAGGGDDLSSAEGRDAAADEVIRQALERERQGAGATGGPATEDGGVGRILGGGGAAAAAAAGGRRRAGPTVDEILRLGRGGGRSGPPPSEAARAAAAGAVGVTLPWLLRKGILSRCKPSQALAMRTLQRLVKVCDKDALMPHLAELVATLIEGLSALEPQALQYMQFHAETQMEMTQDQMERLRLSVSRAGPLQDALDNCYRHLDHAGVVEALMPRLLGLLRSGTGLATRSASAYLVLSLCERAPLEIHRAAPRLLPTLTNTALSERSSTLRRTYSSALSSVARLAPAAGVSRLASRLAQLFREADPDFDKRQRRTLALLLGDLCRRAGGQLGAPGGGGSGGGFASSGWAQILPVAFVARSDPDKPVAQAFEEAWQEGLTQLQLGAAGQGEACRVRNAKDAVTLMLPAILGEVSHAVSSVSRVTKRQGCSGLKNLAKTLGSSLGEEPSGRRLVRRVLSQIPGRTWEGKEELLEAVVALCAAGRGSAVALEPFFWGGAGESGGGDTSLSSSASRGVKRSRSSDPLGSVEIEEEVEEVEGEETEEENGEAVNPQQEGDVAAGVGADACAAGTTAAGSNGGGDDGGGGEGSASDDNDNGAAADDGGEEGSAFEYEDKLGDLDGTAAAKAAATAAGVKLQGQASPQPAGPGARGEPRKDSALEEGLASLDMEDDSPIPFGEVVTLMLSQLRRKNVKFRRAAASSLAALLNSFPECCVYDLVAPTLLELTGISVRAPQASTGGGAAKEDPIMQARAMGCLAAAWPRVSSSGASGAASSSSSAEAAETTATAAVAAANAVCKLQRAHAASLTRGLSGALPRVVWSVRVPIYATLSAVVSRTTAAGGPESSSPVLTGSLLADVVQAVELGAEDAKYSQVRAAAISVVVAMTSRKELRLALTPHKEGLIGAARTAAEDPEPRVAVEGSKAVQNLSWWP